MTLAATLTTETALEPTPLAVYLQERFPDLILTPCAGALTPDHFSTPHQEIAAALTRAAIFDLGYRARIVVTGSDRLRWLNGMVTNAIQTLPERSGNYNFILNAQGRIQGDAYIYRNADDLVIDTDRSQAARLFAHLDHFIIMDDVELHLLDDSAPENASCSIGVAGSTAASALDSLGLNASTLAPLHFARTMVHGMPVTLVRAHSNRIPRYELWFAPNNAAAIWKAILASGVQPIGIQAVEALRVLEGIPRYGVDITDRHLAQETSQTRALNFTKGCYLGQEIVERIRSRATVHRTLRQFSLQGETPTAPVEIHAGDDPAAIGQLTSIAEFRQPEFRRTLALGFVRVEAIERKERILYPGGEAEVLDSLPTPPGL
jgi:folate-binding protein YgfZ